MIAAYYAVNGWLIANVKPDLDLLPLFSLHPPCCLHCFSWNIETFPSNCNSERDMARPKFQWYTCRAARVVVRSKLAWGRGCWVGGPLGGWWVFSGTLVGLQSPPVTQTCKQTGLAPDSFQMTWKNLMTFFIWSFSVDISIWLSSSFIIKEQFSIIVIVIWSLLDRSN